MRPDTAGLSSQQRILAAAMELFARQGFVHTSTAQVAREAATSESQLIKLFGSKEGLLEALFESLWAGLNAEVRHMAAAYPDPVRRLKAIASLVIARIDGDDRVRRLVLFEGRRIGSHGALISSGFRRFVEMIDTLMKQARAAGRLRHPMPTAAIRSLLIGGCEGLLRDRLLAGTAYPARYSRKDIDRAVDLLIDTFFNEAASPGGR